MTTVTIITITEMGERIYSIDVKRREAHRRVRMTRELRRAIVKRGQLLWKTRGFGDGHIGSQAQYTV